MPYQSVLIRNANKVGFMNAKHWIQAIPEVPVMSLAPLAGALIDWMNDRDDDAGVLLLAGRLTELEADALKPFVWSKMLKAAQSVGDAPLEAKLRAKIR